MQARKIVSIIHNSVFALLLLCFAGLVSCSESHHPHHSSLNKIYLANEQIKKVNPEGKIVWAGGRRMDGSTMNHPDEADTWDFSAIAETEGTLAGVWSLMLNNDEWDIQELSQPPFEIEFIDLTTIPMDVSDAWQILEEQGLARPVLSWQLFKSLDPHALHPIYAFYVGEGKFLIVDVITRTSSPEERMSSAPEAFPAFVYGDRST